MVDRQLDERIAAVANGQSGVFSRVQVIGAGGTDDVTRRRRQRGVWLSCTGGVYRLRDHPRTWQSALWVAVLAGDGDAVVSHEAAAALHGLATFRPGPVTVTVPHATARLTQVATVHQSRRLLPEHITTLDGLPVTSVARTFCDLAASYRLGRMALVLDGGLSSSKVSLDGMCATFDDLACRGRKGTRLMRALLAERRPGYVPPSSVLESLFLRLVRRAGLPRPILQFPHPSPAMDGRFVDAAWPERRILIELDSRTWHTRLADFERDRERDVAAQLVAWHPYRFTYDHVTTGGDWVIAVLTAARNLAA
jgi:hypothetical protein